jgi:transcriptional regulator with XRE-family HTH domain
VEDRVISEADGMQDPGLLAGDARSRLQPAIAPAFPSLLERLREERGLSKAELAKRTGLDPSTITRFEQGARMPERETILLLAGALVLPMVDRDRLLASAGFRSELWDDPLLVEIAQLLNEPGISSHAKEEARGVLRMASAYLKMQRLQDY